MESAAQTAQNFVKYVTVALDLGFSKLLEYGCPEEFESKAVRGARVVIPLKTQMAEGTIVEVKDHATYEKVAPIIEISDTPLLSSELLDLAKWMSDYYHTPLHQVLSLFIPKAVKKHVGSKLVSKIERVFTKEKIKDALPLLRKKSKKQALILDTFLSSPKSVFKKELLEKCKTTPSTLQALIEKGFLKEIKVEMERLSFDHIDLIQSEKKKLKEQQQIAVDTIKKESNFHVFLLHGLTGSGKNRSLYASDERCVATRRLSIIHGARN